MSTISVIVPVYNVERYLHRCVGSILAQSFSDFELILVDDGSLDNCGVICDEYAAKDSRIVVIHKENGGLSDARNIGIDWAFTNSDSEWLAFIDSDDWVHPKYLELLHYAAIDNESDVACCFFEECTGDYCFSEDSIRDIRIFNVEEFFCSYPRTAIVAWAKIYRKYLFERIRYPFGKIHEDSLVIYKVLFAVDSMPVIMNPLYAYFKNDRGITSAQWSLKKLVLVQVCEEQACYFYRNHHYKALELIVNNGLCNIAGMISTNLKAINADTTDIERQLRKRMRILFRKYRRWIKYDMNSWVYEIAYPTRIRILRKLGYNRLI